MPAGAIAVTTEIGLLADFSLSASLFTLPLSVLDETVEFGPNHLNHGEGYATALYDANGLVVNTSSYTYSGYRNIAGCACTGGYLDQPLITLTGTFFLIATSGSFDVTDIYIYQPGRNAVVSNIRSCSLFPGDGATDGCFPGPGSFPGNVPEPGTLALLGLGLAGLGLSRSRKANWVTLCSPRGPAP